jgi:aspartate/glutamate racemase
VLLAGTELPLILRQQDVPEVPLLDTTVIHVEAAVARLLSQSPAR